MGLTAVHEARPGVLAWAALTSALAGVGCDRSADMREDAPARVEVIAPAAPGAIGAYAASGETPFDRLRSAGPVDGGVLPRLPRRAGPAGEVDGGVAL